MAYIYKITNDINDNVYVGETIRPLEKRWQQHKKHATDINKCGHLQLAMRKYGIEHFLIELIEECPDDIRFEREKYWIEQYNSYYDGYNSNLGGEGSSLYSYEDIYELWEEGYTTSQICEKLGCCDATVHTALQRYNIGRIDHINRIFAKPVEQYRTNGELVATYPSANAAGHSLGLANGSNILKCCLGEIKTSKGYIWKFVEDKTPIEQLVVEKKKKTTGKRVRQLTLEGEVVAEYDSCEYAGKAIGKNGSGINRCARGERHTAFGYKWEYID